MAILIASFPEPEIGIASQQCQIPEKRVLHFGERNIIILTIVVLEA